MFSLLKIAISDRTISQQDTRRIDLIETLLERFRILIQSDSDTVHLGHDSSSSDEEATVEAWDN